MEGIFISIVSAIILSLIGVIWKINANATRTLFERIDEIKISVQDVKDNINKNYLDKAETEKLIDLTNRPIFEKISHIEEQIGEVKDLLEKAFDKK